MYKNFKIFCFIYLVDKYFLYLLEFLLVFINGRMGVLDELLGKFVVLMVGVGSVEVVVFVIRFIVGFDLDNGVNDGVVGVGGGSGFEFGGGNVVLFIFIICKMLV